MVTSHDNGLHNNACVAKERSIQDIRLGYNNLKNCVQGANIIKHYVCWKARKGYKVCIIMAQQLQHSMDNKQYEKPYKFEDNRKLKARQR